MDTIEFLFALFVFVAISGWYCVNEAAKAGGVLGLLGLDLEPPPLIKAETTSEGRYRARERVAPAGRGMLAPPSDKRAYRPKREESAIDRSRRLAAENPLEDLR